MITSSSLGFQRDYVISVKNKLDSTLNLCFIIIFILLQISSSNGSILKDPSICGRPKCIVSESSKFQYRADTSYQYKYSIDITTLFDGTSKNVSSLYVDAEFNIDFISPCEAVLQVTEAHLKEKEPTYNSEYEEYVDSDEVPHSTFFSKAISQYSMRFSFNDGIVTELCPHAEETSWVLNFKRGVLSAFQNSMERFDIDFDGIEVDVNGECLTSYKLGSARATSLIISKKKDISNCVNRYKHHSILQSTPYIFRSNHQSLPVMKSKSECELVVDHNIYSKISCQEEHVFQPFSGHGSGATTRTSAIVTFLSENNITLKNEDNIEKRTSLLFDHNLTTKPTSGELKTSRDLIKAMCRLNADDVQSGFPNVFTEFIHTARLLSYPALTQLFNRAGAICNSGRKHIVDALPFLGSNAAIAVIRDVIIKNGVSKDIIKEWLFALSFVPRPDLTTVTLLSPLMTQDKADAQYILAVSSVVHSYCKWYPNCNEQYEIIEIVHILEAEINLNLRNIQGNRTAQEKVIVAFKALGNIGISTITLGLTLKECFENIHLPKEIRIAAIEAHRRMPCEDHRDYFLTLFRDQKVDPEIRISLYLEVMKCPTYTVVKTIKHSLNHEEVNQVGSFVWSHLQNLLKSSIPSRVEIQGLLQDKDLSKKFSSDVRKFSRNFEGSVFFDEYNAGGNFESNVIFSPKSYLPRSAMMNLTVDLFGESINIFEVSGRVEGFENYIESIFGPMGPFNAKRVKEMVDKYRFLRSVPDQLVDKVEALPNVIDNNFGNPKVQIGTKIFGNEFKYDTFFGNNEIKAALASVNPMAKLQELLSGKEFNYKKSVLFLDTKYVVPTGSGLPICLNAVGTAAVNLQLAGFLKADNFSQSFDLDMEAKIRPSVAVDVVGTMSVDAYYASTAIKLKTNLYSSSDFEGQLKVKGTRLISLNFNLPKNKTEIITAQSELIVMKGDEEERQTGITQGRLDEHLCSNQTIDQTLGLKFCAHFQFPNASLITNSSTFILNGPTKFAVSLEKADPTAKKYLLEYKWETTKNATLISFIFDTPGSKLKRELSARFNLDRNSQNLTLLLQMANDTYKAHGNYRNTENDRYISVSIDSNGKKYIDAEIGLKIKEGKNGHTFQPRLYLAIKSETVAELSGTLKCVDKKGTSQCDVALSFNTKKVATKLFGYGRKTDASVSFYLRLDYKFDKFRSEHIRMEAILSNRSSNHLDQTIGELSLESSAYPHFNFDSSLKYQTAHGHIDCQVGINIGPNLKDKKETLAIEVLFKYFKTIEGNKMETSIEITKPSNKTDIFLSLYYQSSGPDTTIEGRVRYSSGKEIILIMDLKIPRGITTFIQVNVNLTLPGFTPLLFKIKINEKIPNDYEIDTSGTWISGHTFTARGSYQDKSTAKTISHVLKLQVLSPSFSEVVISCKLLNSDLEFRTDLQADYKNERYSLMLKHMTPSAEEIQTYIDLRYKGAVYTFTSSVSLRESRQVLLEFHLDEQRDIHIALRDLNKPNQKEAGIEIKWDANRDPGQKFAASVEFARSAPWNYDSGFMVSYPGRTVKGGLVLVAVDSNYTSLVHLEWSPVDVVNLKAMVIYKHDQVMELTARSELLTPFENWKRTSLSGGVWHTGNMLRANGSIFWQDNQNIAVDLFGNYSITNTDFKVELNASMISTIPQVSSVRGSFSHKQNPKGIDTNIYLQYKPDRTVALQSVWNLAKDDKYTNITGQASLISPFNGYRKGVMKSAFSFTNQWDIRGMADVDVDRRKYTLSIEGHLKEFSNSIFTFNITTPVPDFQFINGRFGYSELRRHLVAEISSPIGATGIEILLSYNTFTNFDIKLSVATPLEFLRRGIFIGKLKEDNVDFRIGWNSVMLGFSGVWHFREWTDFEYSYKLYTPLSGFEENGVILKLKYTNSFNIELDISAQATDTKFGLRIIGEPKPRMFQDISINSQKTEPEDTKNEDEEYENYDYDEDENKNAISWRGLIELDTFLYPTMKGNLEIDENGPLYTIVGSMVLPDGTAELYDEFTFVDVFTMSNKLHLTSPCDCFKEMKAFFNFHKKRETLFEMEYDFNIKSFGEPLKAGLLLKYTKDVRGVENDTQVQNILFKFYSPLEALQIIALNATMETQDSHYNGNVTLEAKDSLVTLIFNYKREENYLNAKAGLSMDTPVFQIQPFEVSFLKDERQKEKNLAFNFNPKDAKAKNFHVDLLWQLENNYLKGNGKIQTPFSIFSNISGHLIFDRTNISQTSLDIYLFYLKHKIQVNTLFKNDYLSVNLETSFPQLRKAELNGSISTSSRNVGILNGIFTYNEKTFEVSGDITRTAEIPIQVQLVYKASRTDRGHDISAKVFRTKSGFKVVSSVFYEQEFIKMNMDIDIQSKLDFDINLQVQTSLPSVKFLNANVKMINEDPWNCTLHFSANSSIPDYQKIILGLEYLLTTRSGHVSTLFDLAQTRGEFQSQWFWAAMEKMYLNTSTSYETNNISKHATLIGFYKNPRQSFKQFTVGVDVSLNRDAWAFGTNVALALPSTRNMEAKLSLKLPSPQPETHFIEGKLEYLKDLSQMSQMLQYTTLNSREMYITSGEGSITKGSIDGWCKFEWGKNQLKTINNILNVTRHDNLVDVTYRLETPRYKEDTLVTKVFYDYIEKYHKIRAQLYSPSSRYITGGKIDYNSFSNMNGTVNTTTPFEALPYTGINFETVTQSLRNKRFVEVFWPNNTAFLDSEYTYKTKDTNTHIVGAVLIELPITTRHIGKMDYEYKEGPQHTTGLATVEYNKAKFLEGKYSCESQSSAGFEKDIINIEIENGFSPIGINYIHDLSYNAGSGGTNLPTIDKKHAQLFNLHNITIFNLTGEVLVKTRETGKDITLTGTHTNRTVTLKTNYDFLDHEFRQKSHWELAPHVWATYNVVINNKTTKEKREQHIELDMAYPRRDFAMKGYYQILNNSLSSEIAIQWDKQNVTKKSIGASIDWKRISSYPNKQHAVLSIKHPSFKRDVTFNAHYLSGDKEFVDIASEVVYSTENNKKLRLSGKLLDNSQNLFKQYDYELLGNHPATRLDLKVFGDLHAGNGLYKSNNVAQYKRTYLPLQKGESNAFLNTVIKEIEIEKITQREHSFLKGKYEGKSPLYTITGAVRNGTSDLDSTSIFFINIEEKLIVGTVNFTPDATESFHMYGIIPDARNAKFNAWRNYEDDSISDVSYYLRLNHSHLVTSKLIWRPEIEYEVKSGIEEMYSALWNSILESVDYWKVYLASETNEAIHDVWLDAKPVVQRFLDDISELKVIADDFEEFKLFLNNSYNANEFYVRDIVGLATYIIDEFSLRRHIDFVPGIVNEMWDIMGESGKAVHESILWIIEAIKTSYQKAVAFINGILKGESSEQISEIFQGFVQKYDKFIKELHVSFVKHLEELWHGLSAMVQHHWNTMLETIEPTFIHLIHYLEALSWKASKEILDFLYERKNDIVDSPYFSKFANFTQDVDRIYKDIMKNNTLTNIGKYSKIIIEFVKEKYFTIIPFGKELQAIVLEIIEEFRELEKLPSIQFAIKKFNEVYGKFMWFYDYLDVGNRFQRAVTLIHSKLTDITQTALQAENRYREAKTKFIFDPENGIVELEQKLPMSWHTFNETPKFEEIPEYKYLASIQEYFDTSNTTFWSIYHDYNYYSESSNWLPPFKAQAVLAGPQHIITFDRKFIEYQGTCSYLLAADFVDHNFTLVISYDDKPKRGAYEISFIAGKKVVSVNIFNDEVTFQKGMSRLPLEFGDIYVYQETSMINIDSVRGFSLRCNLKFDTCTFTLSGWYFGKTAGLLGTMDNEPSTDFLTSQKTLETDIAKFAQSWLIDANKCSSNKNLATKEISGDPDVINQCDLFFKSKTSPFYTCFTVVDPRPFMKMCLNVLGPFVNQTCSSAMAYMQTCLMENTPLRIPDSCVKCQLNNGSEFMEGEFHKLENESVPRSTDIVFIVEAKDCNKNILEKRNMASLLTVLSKELIAANIKENRFSLVVFGGDGVLDLPRSIVVGNNVFSEVQQFLHYFENIPTGNGNSDIFGALRFATNLLFRPAVAKTFILLPCTTCDPSNMTLDYTVLHQVLLENDIKLHILMNEVFRVDKDRVNKMFYGIDSINAYTKKDFKNLKGSTELRRQVRLPKAHLGFCIPLAMESNGTIFSAKKLELTRKNAVKKFVTVFTRRVALTAIPCQCQKCECTADNDGMSYMECFPCQYPTPGFYNENDMGDGDNYDDLVMEVIEDDEYLNE